MAIVIIGGRAAQQVEIRLDDRAPPGGHDCRAATDARGRQRDTARDAWVNAMIDSGVPAECGEVLRALTATIASGHGSQPNDDVLAATGTKPTSFREFGAKTAAAWK
jgi:hypothetical protein